MYNESGFGKGGSPYEYVVTPKMTPVLRMKKLLMIGLYILWGVGLLVVGSIVKLILPLLAFIPISLWILVFFTWRYTQVAYEYSFIGGVMKVNRLLGERSRRTIAEINIRDLDSVSRCHGEDINAFEADRKIFAASASDAERLVSAVWTDENNQKSILFFEPDEKAIRILSYYNSSIDKSIFSSGR